MSGILLNPIQTTNAPGSFVLQSHGVIQGAAFLQPNTRYALTQGTIGGTVPLYGGFGISEMIPAASNVGQTGLRLLTPATSIATLTGFTGSDQSSALINTPQSQVPIGTAGQSISFFRLGSQVELAVNCSPTLVDLDGGLINQQVSWDFNAQQLIPFVAAYAAATPTAYAYTSATGILALTFAAAPGPVATDVVNLTGFTGANVALNGSFMVVSTASAGAVLNLQATPGLGVLTPTLGTLVAGGGALPVKVSSIYSANSLTVVQSGGFYNYNQAGTAAIIVL